MSKKYFPIFTSNSDSIKKHLTFVTDHGAMLIDTSNCWFISYSAITIGLC